MNRQRKNAAVWVAAAAGCASALMGWARAGAGEIRLDRLSSEATMGLAPREPTRWGDRTLARSLKRPVIDLRSQATTARAGQVLPLPPEVLAALAASADEQRQSGGDEPTTASPAVERIEIAAVEPVSETPRRLTPPVIAIEADGERGLPEQAAREEAPELVERSGGVSEWSAVVQAPATEPVPVALEMIEPDAEAQDRFETPVEQSVPSARPMVGEPLPASVERSSERPMLPPMPAGIDPDGRLEDEAAAEDRVTAESGALTVERIDGPSELVQVRALDGAAFGAGESGWRVCAAGDALAGRVEVRTGAGVRARLSIAGGWTITVDRLTRAEVSVLAAGEVQAQVRLGRGRIELARTALMKTAEGKESADGAIEVITDDRRLVATTPMTVEVEGFTGTRFEFVGK